MCISPQNKHHTEEFDMKTKINIFKEHGKTIYKLKNQKPTQSCKSQNKYFYKMTTKLFPWNYQLPTVY